ncbi:MAG: serine/threonine protein kinase [Thermoflexales bacterium]|nr:serine/threonine protein kinase [Thermoflexales bacterium]
MLQAGDRIGRYEIQALIGEGGFGKVYRAWDPELERCVAIKELSIDRQAGDPTRYTEYSERFKLERRVQGQLRHPHIVSVYDLVQQNGNGYLVEELVDGSTLRDLLDREGVLTPGRVIQIGIAMSQAIAAAWEHNIVHRDIKPSNILIRGDGQAVLTDFGIAQLGQMSQRTQADSRHPGTPAYMSPEQESSGGYLDERSDLYTLGLVLYEALSGKSFKRERVPVRQLAPDVPKGLEKVLAKALAREPGERYQCALDLEMALRNALDEPRAARLWWIGGGLVSAVTIGLAVFSFQTWGRGMATPVTTPTVTETLPPSPTPVSSVTATATQRATPPPSSTSTVSSTATPSMSPTPTRPKTTPAPPIAAPRLLSPPGASTTTSPQMTLRWEGKLPDSTYGFLASVHHMNSSLAYTSPVLNSTQWTVQWPGDAVGEWHWSVAVVKRSNSRQALTHSDEWTFYYNPFPSSSTSPFSSPLPTPTP